ncbi:hypothetical protein THAOC_06212, partial [Thalassiosira oceanica]
MIALRESDGNSNGLRHSGAVGRRTGRLQTVDVDERRRTDSPDRRSERNEAAVRVPTVKVLYELEPIGDFVEDLAASEEAAAVGRDLVCRAIREGAGGGGAGEHRRGVRSAESAANEAPGAGRDLFSDESLAQGSSAKTRTTDANRRQSRIRPAPLSVGMLFSSSTKSALAAASFKTGGFRRASELNGAATPRDREVEPAALTRENDPTRTPATAA